MLLSWFQTRDEDYLMFQSDVYASHQRHRRANSTDPNPCQLQYLARLRGKDVYSALPNSFMNVFCCFPCASNDFRAQVHFIFRCSDMVVPDSFWHVSGLALTLRWREGIKDRLVHARSLQSSRNPCQWLWDWQNVSLKALEHSLYTASVSAAAILFKIFQVQIELGDTVALCSHWASSLIFNTCF